MRKVTTAMTAKSARKSPNRLITCANHTRRITSMRRTSRKDNGAGAAGGAAVAVTLVIGKPRLYVGARQRGEQFVVGRAQQRRDLVPVGTLGVRVANRRRPRAQHRGRAHVFRRRFIQERVLL